MGKTAISLIEKDVLAALGDRDSAVNVLRQARLAHAKLDNREGVAFIDQLLQRLGR